MSLKIIIIIKVVIIIIINKIINVAPLEGKELHQIIFPPINSLETNM